MDISKNNQAFDNIYNNLYFMGISHFFLSRNICLSEQFSGHYRP